MGGKRTAEHQRAVLERRRSNAARPVPARRARRQGTRSARVRAAIIDAT